MVFDWHHDTIPPYSAKDFIYGLEMSNLPKSEKKISESQKLALAQLMQAHSEKKYSKIIELANNIPKGIRNNSRMIEIVNNATRRLKFNA